MQQIAQILAPKKSPVNQPGKPAFLTNNAIPTERFAIAIYIILIEKRFRAFFTRLIFDAV
jgi:hypothetical protein